MGEIIIDALTYLIALILYYIEVLLCEILDLVYNMFEVFAGIKYVQYLNPTTHHFQETALINVFFDNSAINIVFWGMAALGIVLTFAFAIVAAVRKSLDSYDKVKLSFSQIISNCFKSITLILLMSTIVGATITGTNVLMQQLDELFNRAQQANQPEEIYFDSTDYATMFCILDTIGNFALNQSFDNTYNINECYNQIRPYLQTLGERNVFKFSYASSSNAQGVAGNYVSWQKMIRDIGVAANYDSPLALDEYNEPVNNAILACVDAMKVNGSFKPITYYKNDLYHEYNGGAELGKVLMISATFNAASNDKYNVSPSLNDELRGPYYRGERDIYSFSQFNQDFTVKISHFNHIIVLVGTIWLIKEFLAIIMNCCGRIFNIMLLYIVAPPFIATMPLDDGGKFKQWTTAFVIQALGIFGTFISVRLLVMFIPIIMSSDLILFESVFMDIIAKVILVIGIAFTASRAAAMISGILADNAGMQSIMAGDAGAAGAAALTSVGKKVAGIGLGAAKSVGKGVANVTGLTTAANAIGNKLSSWNKSMKENGGLFGAAKSGWSTKEGQKAAADQKQQQNMSKIAEGVGGMQESLKNMNEKLGAAGGMKGLNQKGGGETPGSNNEQSSNPTNLNNPQGGDNNSQGGDNNSQGGDKFNQPNNLNEGSQNQQNNPGEGGQNQSGDNKEWKPALTPPSRMQPQGGSSGGADGSSQAGPPKKDMSLKK